MNAHPQLRGSSFAVPADDEKAAELALRDAARSRQIWLGLKQVRQRRAREHLAQEARFLEGRILETANALIERAARRDATTSGVLDESEDPLD